MPVRVTRATAVAVLLLAGVQFPGLAECHLSSEDLVKLATLNSRIAERNAPDSYQPLGIFYLDHRCYTDARKAFTAVVEGQGGNRIIRASASNFLRFLDGLLLLEQGELKSARNKLVEILKGDFHTDLLERVPFVLADILSRAPDAESWKVLEESLHELARRGNWSAKA